ncbi:syntaxin-124-like [Lactuca sativa]|uniref:syntaxin-124-like n=1 Tax=Lactuca sativa TaxID=4236 RepID=UPI001C68F06C|nr:syntaxin-124-like [Lactuca sativa]
MTTFLLPSLILHKDISSLKKRNYTQNPTSQILFSDNMNDLFSNSFKQYLDLKKQAYLDDIEGGQGGGGVQNETVDLDKFFHDVENVKQDMMIVENLYKKLQDSNKESKTIQNASKMKQLRSKMDSDFTQVLKHAKNIKGKLEALEKSNLEHRKIAGCGPGSSADRTRTSVVGGLGKKLKIMMDDFQALRVQINDEYKETMGRRYFTITGEKPNDELIDSLIASGKAEDFVQKAIQEQGRGQIVDTISEIQERHDAIMEIEKNLIELHQIFLDMAVLVEAQGQQLNDIESHVAHASSFVRRGIDQLVETKDLQKSSRKCTCIAIGLILSIVFVFILFCSLQLSRF